ncbi:unnamed protein product [Urochloa decumbens]|uniref:Uncharacterized protein n=1 Tax=Urochloa decumbens TaxID=240449 RepID=A0ABC9BVY1_9POAL
MAKLTMSCTKALAQIVNQLGLEKPKITSEEIDNGMFHATIEVDLVNWVSMGFRGPREFTGKSSISARRAIRKAAGSVVFSLEKYGMVKINDFSGKKLKLWKRRVMDIAKICMEVAEERDELEKNHRYLERKNGKLLVENARMKVKISMLQDKIICLMEDKEGNTDLINENNQFNANS